VLTILTFLFVYKCMAKQHTVEGIDSESNVVVVVAPCWSGPGAAVPAAGQPGGAGLREGLPELHLRLHLQQLPGAVQPAVPAPGHCEAPTQSIITAY